LAALSGRATWTILIDADPAQPVSEFSRKLPALGGDQRNNDMFVHSDAAIWSGFAKS
jgi:hypothetical protein